MHQGVEAWLKQLAERGDEAEDIALIADLEQQLPRSDGRRHLQLVIEAIVENYTEYRDYNATTTQSDRGEMVYMLLDFLRIKAGYERIHWNLRPVMMGARGARPRQSIRRRRNCGGARWPSAPPTRQTST